MKNSRIGACTCVVLLPIFLAGQAQAPPRAPTPYQAALAAIPDNAAAWRKALSSIDLDSVPISKDLLTRLTDLKEELNQQIGLMVDIGSRVRARKQLEDEIKLQSTAAAMEQVMGSIADGLLAEKFENPADRAKAAGWASTLLAAEGGALADLESMTLAQALVHARALETSCTAGKKY